MARLRLVSSLKSWWQGSVGRYRSQHFSLRLTVEGWCMVAAMLLIGMAALNTGAPLLYLVFSMMCSFFILSALLAANTMRGLSAERSVARVWPALQPMTATLGLRNRKLLTASYSMRVQDMAQDGSVVGAVFFDKLPPGAALQTQTYECRFLRRGVQQLARIDVATRFPFGLIERRISFDHTAEILVLPPMIVLDSNLREALAELGDFEAPQKGRGSSLYGLRDYTPDFPARDIHWKVSARRGHLVVREYESEERRRACVVLDNRRGKLSSSSEEEAKLALEMGIILAASVVSWLCEHGHEVELRTASGVVGYGSGASHVLRCRRVLAMLELLPSEGLGGHDTLRGGIPGALTIPILASDGNPTNTERVVVGIREHREKLMEALGGVPS